MNHKKSEVPTIDFYTLNGLELGKIVAVDNDQDVRIHFENRMYLSIFHPGSCCEGVWLHDDIGDYQDMVGGRLYQVELVNGEHPSSGLWYYAKLQTSKGWYTLSFDGDVGSGWYSMELVARMYQPDTGKGDCVSYKGKDVKIEIENGLE